MLRITIKKMILNLLYIFYKVYSLFFKIGLIDLFLIFYFIKVENQYLDSIEKILDDNKDDDRFLEYTIYINRYNHSTEKKFYKSFFFENETQMKNHISFLLKLEDKFPNNYKLLHEIAICYGTNGDKSMSFKYFNKSLKFQRSHLLNNNEVGIIFVASMPRSGTGFVTNALSNGFKLNNLAFKYEFIDTWFPNWSFYRIPDVYSGSIFEMMSSGVITGHPIANEVNLTAISHMTDKLVVNFRDPRQSIISWTYYMQYLAKTKNYSTLVEYRIPKDYFFLKLEDQINWQINNYFLDVNIEWIKSWISAKNDQNFLPEILITNYNDLVTNQHQYLDKIIKFYNLQKFDFKYPNKPKFKNDTHFRKGDIDEWKSLLTKEQIKLINSKIPEEYFKQFNWDQNV